jgi:hypothetical protein
MKQLPDRLGEELFLKIDYVICRFMKQKKAYKTSQNQSNVIFTVKKVKEENLEPQYHLHLRFNGRDVWFNDNDSIDVDFYINEKEFTKILSIIDKKEELREPYQEKERYEITNQKKIF